MASRPRGRRHGQTALKRAQRFLFFTAALAGMTGCEGEEPAPLGAGGPDGAPALAAAGEAASLHGDMIAPADTGVTTAQGALGSGSGSGSGKDPKVIYLRYADGSEQH